MRDEGPDEDAGYTAARGLLTVLRAELDREERELTDSLAAVREARSDGTADDEHDPEGPTLTAEWSRLSGQSRETGAKHRAIDDALARLDGGTYGTCTACGLPIAPDRLLARPAAAECISCARSAEARRR